MRCWFPFKQKAKHYITTSTSSSSSSSISYSSTKIASRSSTTTFTPSSLRNMTTETKTTPMNSQALDTTVRLAALRELMKHKDYNLQAYVIPTEDAHQSEYIAECDMRRAFISGFTGSAGMAIVTLEKALLFTDGRYFLQASKQLDNNWTLMKQGLDVTWQEFLIALPNGTRVGIDPTLITIGDARSLSKSLTAKTSALVTPALNLVDQVWGEKRPARPANAVNVLPVKYSGKSTAEKLRELRAGLAKRSNSSGAAARSEIDSKDSSSRQEIAPGISGVILSSLDDIAWLFNLRGQDIDYNPVFFAYANISIEDAATLYIDASKLNDSITQELKQDKISVRPHGGLVEDLQALSSTLEKQKKKVLLTSKASLALAEAIGDGNYDEARSPVTDAKAIKNETELEGMRQCHLRDGAAIVSYFAWLEEELHKGKPLDEVDGATQLEDFRKQQTDFVGLSFTTISSTGPNAAVIHYSPEKGSCSRIDPNQIYLCDSGAQYKDGTTDTTRTVHFGIPTQEEKRAFTRVLQGHIAIDELIFPKGTTGYLLDAFARAALWKDGLDFRHGTGHGVGSYLNVHEGPHGIGTRIAYNDVALASGMTVSNEPGFYKDGHFGIRIENIVLVKEVKTLHRFGDRDYLGFEHVTMVPIQTSLIEPALLSQSERDWINKYNAEVLQKVSPLLQNDPRGLSYLQRQTRPM